MNPGFSSPPVVRFRWRLRVALMLVISTVTILVLLAAERRATADAEQGMRTEFERALAGLRNMHALRHAALVERCRELVRKPRLHAALEDGALDLLYPSARDELRDLMEEENDAAPEHAGYGLHGEFYRFLDLSGRVIEPPPHEHTGTLLAEESARIALRRLPESPQFGYLARVQQDVDGPLFDVIAMPVRSTETHEVIAALVVGFEPAARTLTPVVSDIQRGVWLGGRLYLMDLPVDATDELAAAVGSALNLPPELQRPTPLLVRGVPHLMFWQQLNPGSGYPPAYEVSLYALTELHERQARLRWQVLGSGIGVLLIGLAASGFIAGRFARPVERLARDSAQYLAERQRAEAKLEHTSEELQRAARFSANASHQLKTPVAVLRAGLEELRARHLVSPEGADEVAALIRQTYRLSGVIEDLLLLSRLDAGRLAIDFTNVDLAPLIESAIDDLSVRPDADSIKVSVDIQRPIAIVGEKRYVALVLQNLLENAAKYNRGDGLIRVVAASRGDRATVHVGNTGRPIPPAAQAHVFERFHRGSAGEDVPGYGLGLNLARELARLHGGDVQLMSSAEDWTVFEAHFRVQRRGAALDQP